jgi:electron transfer flavoprotein alpha subunit
MNGILVVFEYRDASEHSGWSRLSWEALAAGVELAQHTRQPLMAAVAAGRAEEVGRELATKSLDRAYIVLHDLLRQYTADGFTLALAQLIRKVEPAFVVFPHTYQVRDFAPRLAAQFEQMLIADAIGFRFEDGRPVWVRQLLQGKLNADYRHSGAGPCFVSIQAGAFRADGLAAGATAIEVFTPELAASQVRSQPEEPFRASENTVDLASAPLIVSVGRGIKEKDNLPVVEDLARALGAELGASRPICDNGWLPMERQVGSSGQTVSPKLYLAIGISGAIQHLVGMKGSKSVIAINKDENAPIFDVADYGIVGDLFQVVPALTAAVLKAKQA